MAHPGDKITCPACGRESVAKAVRVCDGWRIVEERIVCALCNAALPASSRSAADEVSRRASAALVDLLGAETPSRAVPPLHDAETRFCRDCRHFLRHPFVSRCLLHERPTEPMADCADFSPTPVSPNHPGEPDA